MRFRKALGAVLGGMLFAGPAVATVRPTSGEKKAAAIGLAVGLAFNGKVRKAVKATGTYFFNTVTLRPTRAKGGQK